MALFLVGLLAVGVSLTTQRNDWGVFSPRGVPAAVVRQTERPLGAGTRAEERQPRAATRAKQHSEPRLANELRSSEKNKKVSRRRSIERRKWRRSHRWKNKGRFLFSTLKKAQRSGANKKGRKRNRATTNGGKVACGEMTESGGRNDRPKGKNKTKPPTVGRPLDGTKPQKRTRKKSPGTKDNLFDKRAFFRKLVAKRRAQRARSASAAQRVLILISYYYYSSFSNYLLITFTSFIYFCV